MDFKVAGTEDGITAFQMDIKVKNVAPEVMKVALAQAKRGRMHILSKMAESIDTPNQQLSEYAPRIITFKVDVERIGLLIGPSGKTIKGISERYGVNTNIDDDGSVTVYCKDKDSGESAKGAFMALLEEPEVGKVYDGVVKRIVDFGAFIEFLPGKEGLCHISKLAPQRVESVSDVLQMNQSVPVKIIEIDRMGRVNLSLIYEGSDDSVREDNRGPRDRDGRGRDHRPSGGFRR
jgi:polyribonucleotide nucleotidyltransferase